MKKPFYYLFGLAIFFGLLSFTNTSRAEAASNNDLVSIDTSIVPDSYELEVSVNKNDLNKEDMIIFVDDHNYKIVNGKLVEVFAPSLMPFSTNRQSRTLTNSVVPYATDSQNVTLANGASSTKLKYAASGTTVSTGSTGPAELREHKIIDDVTGQTLSSIRSSAASIGCQKTVSWTGYYRISIQNLSATTQTWNWTITF